MTLSSTGRRWRWLVFVAAAVAAAAATVLLSTGRSGASAGETPAMTPSQMAAMSHTSGVSAKEVALQTSMDKLWEDHINWTRQVIISFAAGLPDLKAAETRLLRNQTDIGDAIKPFYGAAAGTQLTSLLRTHILQAATLLQAAKAGNKPALAKAQTAWYANAHQIAAFLAKTNPDNWKLPAMTSMMNTHLALTTQEAVARLQGNWTADIAAFDHVQDEILEMSHMLTAGIVAQFPNRF
jgi:hypothetical protein